MEYGYPRTLANILARPSAAAQTPPFLIIYEKDGLSCPPSPPPPLKYEAQTHCESSSFKLGGKGIT